MSLGAWGYQELGLRVGVDSSIVHRGWWGLLHTELWGSGGPELVA